MAFGAPIETAMNEPGVFFQALFGYLAVVAVVSGSKRIRFSWKWFAPGLAAAFCVSLAATWMFADLGVCRIM
ncbi:hypothetical protein [Paraburkholderia sp. CNPSo 3281]|nr:hypothetical protein [Paraburkholderia sp. CNPSo 3281]MCP3721274.1 hypothetical protein [Paraburkholderia sp. CNPSo 3281]